MPRKFVNAKNYSKISQEVIDKIMDSCEEIDFDEDVCWRSKYFTNQKCHPMICVNGRSLFCHRIMLQYSEGEPQPDKQLALHSCNTKNCVSPYHLYWGSQSQNSGIDRRRDGTDNRGERHNLCKLTKENVIAIRNDNRIARVIALDYNITKSTVEKIKKRVNWFWLE
jgi:hypothetical protein